MHSLATYNFLLNMDIGIRSYIKPLLHVAAADFTLAR